MMRSKFSQQLFWSSVCCSLVAIPASAALPLVAGNFSIANTFFHGDAHVALLGDSIQNGLTVKYTQTWNVDHWSGIVSGANLTEAFNGSPGAVSGGISQPFVQYENTVVPDSTAAPGVVPDAAPCVTQQYTFKPITAGPVTDLRTNEVYEADLSAPQQNYFKSGKWADVSTGTIHADAIIYANPNGIASGLQMDVHLNSYTASLASAPVDAYSATPGLIKIPTSYAAQTWNPGYMLETDFHVLPGTTPAANSNLIVAGVRYYTGQPGFQLANMSQGGEGVDYFINNVNNDLKDYVHFTDTNIAYIWLGQNDLGRYTGSEFEDRMKLLIADYKSIRSDMQFVLVSSYDTNNPRSADFAQALYDISQTDSSTLFLNLYESAGSYSTLDANYLADHVHPNLAGLDYFSGQTEMLMEQAAALAPEPSLGVVPMVALIICSRRRLREQSK